MRWENNRVKFQRWNVDLEYRKKENATERDETEFVRGASVARRSETGDGTIKTFHEKQSEEGRERQRVRGCFVKRSITTRVESLYGT